MFDEGCDGRAEMRSADTDQGFDATLQTLQVTED